MCRSRTFSDVWKVTRYCSLTVPLQNLEHRSLDGASLAALCPDLIFAHPFCVDLCGLQNEASQLDRRTYPGGVLKAVDQFGQFSRQPQISGVALDP